MIHQALGNSLIGPSRKQMNSLFGENNLNGAIKKDLVGEEPSPWAIKKVLDGGGGQTIHVFLGGRLGRSGSSGSFEQEMFAVVQSFLLIWK